MWEALGITFVRITFVRRQKPQLDVSLIQNLLFNRAKQNTDMRSGKENIFNASWSPHRIEVWRGAAYDLCLAIFRNDVALKCHCTICHVILIHSLHCIALDSHAVNLLNHIIDRTNVPSILETKLFGTIMFVIGAFKRVSNINYFRLEWNMFISILMDSTNSLSKLHIHYSAQSLSLARCRTTIQTSNRIEFIPQTSDTWQPRCGLLIKIFHFCCRLSCWHINIEKLKDCQIVGCSCVLNMEPNSIYK